MKVAITGGSGLIGTELTRQLLEKNHDVIHISRVSTQKGKVKTFSWQELSKNPSVLQVDAIVHLAGANVGEKRWTAKRKEVILASRVETATKLYSALSKLENKPKVFVSASGISGYRSNQAVFAEEDTFDATGFLADVVHDWELAADRFKALGLRVVKLRTGLVLAKDKGVLEKMALPIKLGVGAPLGSGEQAMPWIHIQDMAKAYVYAIENNALSGVYNAVADTEGVSNKAFTQELAKVLRRPLFLPAIPAFVLKLLLGEMGEIALEGIRVSNKKIKEAGFTFQFSDLKSALQHLYA